MVEANSANDDTVAKAPAVKEKNLSKRQRRKQPNDKQKWPQHPKIQSMDARQKAYVRVAGLGSSTKKKEVIDPKLDLMSPEVKFGRLLGGTDQRKRHAAVSKLKQYLKARCDINNENGGISEMDLMKLWKGLWYTLFMADKVPVQDELSKRLAELLWCVAGTEEEDEYAGQAYLEMCEAYGVDEDSDDEDVIMEEIVNTLGKEDDEEEDDEEEERGADEEANAEDSGSDDKEDNDEHEHSADYDHGDMEEEEEEEVDESEIPHCRGAHLASLFIRAFFRTIRREWGNMDKYRVDKFYTLIRLYMHEIFKYMASRHWNLGIIRLFNDAMFEEILSQTPNGLRYHLVDLAVDELAKANSNAPLPLTEATFLDTLEPYFAMCQTGGGDDTVQGRVMEKVLERFLSEYSVVSDRAVEERESGKEEHSLVFDQVHVESVGQFIFELASDPETKDQYRKSLYDMHKTYSRRLKKIGVDVELLEGNDEAGGEDEIEDREEDEIETREGEMELQEDEQEDEDDAEVSPPAAKVDPPASEEVKAEHVPKKKRKRKAAKEDEPNDAKKREKKKSKPKGDRKSVVDNETQLLNPTNNAEDDDEEVTISLSEQKRAKGKKGRKKKPKLQEEQPKQEAKYKQERKERRVQWDKVNKSKSYKASMKALVTKDLAKIKASPEKGILLNKGKVKTAKTAKNSRKRAVNYF
jgi:hypothetical protein